MTKEQFAYGIKSGADGMGKHKAMTAASVITTAACLLLISAMFALGLNIRTNMNEFQVENTMLAFVDDALTEAEATLLEPEIQAIPGVSNVTFITRTEAMEEYKEKYADSETRYLEPSVFRNRYAIEMSDPSQMDDISEAVAGVEGVADIRVDEVVTRGFSLIKNAVTVVGVILTFILLTIAIVIMVNTIKLTTMARKEEIAVMKMMGAYDGFVRLPFVCEGCLVGAAGALIAFLLVAVVYMATTGFMAGTGVLALISFAPFSQLAAILLVLNLALGLGVGIAGSLVSVRQHLDV